ncbi:hypothetical protein JMUB5695_03057 [Mycobacterium heckeshornense]|nr:hypothetical protein JMUB5695_03057 [Mycobacterium heckeshornense]
MARRVQADDDGIGEFFPKLNSECVAWRVSKEPSASPLARSLARAALQNVLAANGNHLFRQAMAKRREKGRRRPSAVVTTAAG